MNENKKNLYKLVYKMALTYRLSLENVCILLGEEPTEEKKKEVYQNFDLLFGSDPDVRLRYVILFDYETPKETKSQSNSALALATLFFNKYKLACRDNDSIRKRELINELDAIDNKIKKLKKREKGTRLTQEDYIDVIKYRVKYSVSRTHISEMLNIRRDTIKSHEERLPDSPLKQKIDVLSDYYLDIKHKAAGKY